MLKRFIKYYLYHLGALWLLLNVYNTLDYLHKLSIWGPLTLNADGTPITAWQMFINHNLYKPDYLYLAFLVLVVQLNYLFIFKKYTLWIFALFAIFTGLLSTAILLYFSTNGFTNKYPPDFLEPAVIISGYILFYAMTGEFFNQRLHKLKVRADRSENELQALKRQLDPHFLFNTLNYLYGTALLENAGRTAEGIDIMADMMRYSITGMQETFVTLCHEINFIELYIKLQQLRMARTLQVTAEITGLNQQLKIAPMLLIPFIENAFKFGTSTDHKANVIIIIDVTGNQLVMEVSNIIIPGKENIKGTKNGLSLTRQRLALLYAGKHLLNISTDNNTYRVKLTLLLN